MRTPDYTEEEKQAIEKVLDMGFIIENSNGDSIRDYIGYYEINSHNGTAKAYLDFDKALKVFFKKH